MAKVKNPLFSFGASGTVAKVLTINQSDGSPIARRKPSGYAAASVPQQYMRDSFRDAAASWRGLSPVDKADWRALAAPRSTTAFAKYCLEWIAQGSTLASPPIIPMA
jgi:hypothetical protein